MRRVLKPVIGIHLGSTHVAAALAADQTEPQADAWTLKIPAVVGVDSRSGRILVGPPAKRASTFARQQSLLGFVDQLGALGPAGDPLRLPLGGKTYLPEELCALLFQQLKEEAEAYLGGHPIHDAVISTPAYFGYWQKDATRQAAQLAGLNLLQLLPNPLSTALAYIAKEEDVHDRHFLVFHLGGTLEVALIRVDGELTVLAAAGDPHLGGVAYDEAIVQWALNQLRQEHDWEATADVKALASLRIQAEKVKKELTVHSSTEWLVTGLQQEPYELELSRTAFEELIEPLVARSLAVVESIRERFALETLDAVILSGGSCNIPLVQRALQDHFGGDRVSIQNSGTAAADGVARLAQSMLLASGGSSSPLLVNRSTDSIGIGLGDHFEKIIKAGARLPHTASLEFRTVGHSKWITLDLYQGEGEYVKQAQRLGTVEIGPFDPRLPERSPITVRFLLDSHGALSVEAFDVSTNRKWEVALEHAAPLAARFRLSAQCSQHPIIGIDFGTSSASDYLRSGEILDATPDPAVPLWPVDFPIRDDLDFQWVDPPGLEAFTRPASDPVDCTVFAPPQAAAGEALLVQLHVHCPDQAELAREAAQEFDPAATRRGVTRLGTRIARGSKLTFELVMPQVELHDAVQELVWEGEAAYVAFGAVVPPAAKPGSVLGKVLVSQDSVPIGRITFTLQVVAAGKVGAPPQPVGEARRYRQAFISYASPDRSEVLRRVQMLTAVGIRFFQDVLELDPGDRWQQQLYRHIDESDVMFLFWSTSAKQSEWVTKEWQYGLDTKGDDFIRPVIIEGPPPVPPPKELQHLHFNDRIVYFLCGKQG